MCFINAGHFVCAGLSKSGVAGLCWGCYTQKTLQLGPGEKHRKQNEKGLIAFARFRDRSELGNACFWTKTNCFHQVKTNRQVVDAQLLTRS